METLDTQPGLHQVSVEENIAELFILDQKVAKASPDILPLDSPQELEEFLAANSNAHTYIWNNQEGRLTGYITILLDPSNPSAEILNIGVDPEFQLEGYGTQLMLFAQKLATDSKKDSIKLMTTVSNFGAQEFYKIMGFKVIGEVENAFSDGKSRYILEKKLT